MRGGLLSLLNETGLILMLSMRRLDRLVCRMGVSRKVLELLAN